jgi:hypothetical protein
MKKVILLLVVLALVVPATAMAATEFSLGGFIKLDTIWDSSIMNKNLVNKVFLNNDPANQHGRLRMMATGSRFNFTIKGPKLWGAQVTGYIEADWDTFGAATPPGADSADTGAFRLRHAMFRLTWPETELMFGQYWSFFSEFFPETAADGGFQYRGANVYRPAQIRVTQKFLGVYTAGFMVGTNRLAAGNNIGGALNEESETPHIEAKFAYEQDLYGKAAYYGKPRGLVAHLAAGWQRTYYRTNNFAVAQTFGQDAYNAAAYFIGRYDNRSAPSQMLNHWSVKGTLFVPVITTSSANLAGTASLLTQWAIGQGQGFVLGTWLTDDAYFRYNGTNWIRQLTPALTGYVQGQYYFTNEWFLNVCWGYYHAYGLSLEREFPGGPFSDAFGGVANAGNNDFLSSSSQIAATLWFRPIQAIKFGLSYAFTQDKYMQSFTWNAGSTTTRTGDSHRVQFCGFYYF